ncbi:MAG TPA: PAS domain-containing protein, partial [Streptomyces sp.]|nr:PAS domain-containing protein [Streptomyces sp.]
MDDASLKALLEHLPVSWWEADARGRVVERGGGALPDLPTAQRFVDRLRREDSAPGCRPQDVRRPVPFDGRTFEVSQAPGGGRAAGRIRGAAVEVGARTAGTRRYAAFADFADLAPAAAFIRDRNGRYLWANHSYAHLYGTTPDRVAGSRIEDFDSPADAAQFRALDQD